MQDLAARIVPEIRDPRRSDRDASRHGPRADARAATSSRRSIEQRTGRPRRSEPGPTLAARGCDARSARRPGDPPGHAGRTRAARARASGPTVRVTEPFGYRSSLTLQLHAAAVLTDSGGRPARGRLARHTVPRPALDDRMGRAARGIPGGRTALVGLDPDRRSQDWLDRRPSRLTRALAEDRARSAGHRPGGAADAIAERWPTARGLLATARGLAGLRVTFLTHYYAPEVGAPQTRLERRRALLRELGHDVRIVTGPPHYPTGVVHPGYRALAVRHDESMASRSCACRS